jgi:hypothetical protein
MGVKMLSLRNACELSRSFRGAVDASGQPNGKYLPEIEIERNWGGLTDRQRMVFYEYDGISSHTLVPGDFTTVEEMKGAFKDRIVADLEYLVALSTDKNEPVQPPFGWATSLDYSLWINNDNLDPDMQPRVPVLTLGESSFEKIVSGQGIDNALAHSTLDQEALDSVLGMCRPWPSATHQQQMEMF